MIFGWSPVFGDSTIIGWSTVFAYFLTAALCWRAGRVGMMKTGRLNIWHLLMLALILLGIGKQLNLQTLVVEIGRYLAHRDGWYRDRREIQTMFIAALAAISLCAVVLLFFALRRTGHRERLALLGFVGLATFVVIRTASLHYVDMLLGVRLAGVRLNNLIELSGIALIAIPAATAPSAAALIAQRRRARRSAR